VNVLYVCVHACVFVISGHYVSAAHYSWATTARESGRALRAHSLWIKRFWGQHHACSVICKS